MKKILILALLTTFFANAQVVKYKAADYKLSSDVTKYEEQEFYYDTAQKKYQLSSKRTTFLKGGLVTKIESEMNYFMYVKSTMDFVYKNGQLDKMTIASSGTVTEERYSYQNGKIVSKTVTGDTPSKTEYVYDAKGNLSKETVYEDGVLVKKIAYSNYTAPTSYFKKITNCYNETVQSTYEQTFKNNCLMIDKVDGEYYKGQSTYEYDKYGNELSITSDGKTTKNSYGYDAKGNVIQSMKIQQGFDGMADTNYFTFAKVTFANGKIAGNTSFNASFVKKYESSSASYDVNFAFNSVSGEQLTKAMNDLKASLNSSYKIKKNQDNTFNIKDENGEEITNSVDAVKSKNDILAYDILYRKSLLLKNFYNDAVKVGEWYSMEELPSPSGLYWIFSQTPEFFVIQNGVLADMSLYKLVKTQKEDDFIVQEAGIDKYIIRNLNSKGYETFYPLEFLNN